MEWGEIVKFFAALFAIMNPIGSIPIFLSVTGGRSNAERAGIAWVATVAVTAILAVCVLIGAALLHVFDISIAGLRTAGGLIVLSIAYSLLNAQPSGMRHDEAGDDTPKSNPAIYPLAMPLMAGPGAIATVIVFAQSSHGVAGTAALIAVMAVLLYLGMRLAVPVSKLLGESGMNMITRIMGIILASIAVQMIFAGAKVLLQG